MIGQNQPQGFVSSVLELLTCVILWGWAQDAGWVDADMRDGL